MFFVLSMVIHLFGFAAMRHRRQRPRGGARREILGFRAPVSGAEARSTLPATRGGSEVKRRRSI